MTKGSLLVTDNIDCDDIDNDDDLAIDCEVESYAAAAANSTSQPRETAVQENPSAESQLSCGLGRVSYRPASSDVWIRGGGNSSMSFVCLKAEFRTCAPRFRTIML